jgi:hypothetical protein
MPTPDGLFSQYKSALTDVAKELHLSIEKYRHDMAMWQLSGPHPKGGTIRIDIQISDQGDVFLLRWWLFGLDEHRNWIFKADQHARELNKSTDAVIAAIKQAHAQISDWPFGEWNNQRSKDEVDLVAEIEFCLDETAQLGAPAWFSGIRPQHRIPGRPYSFMGQIDLIGVKSISPGQCCRAKATCIIAERDRPYFVPGFCWHICKVDRIVGYARYIAPYGS